MPTFDSRLRTAGRIFIAALILGFSFACGKGGGPAEAREKKITLAVIPMGTTHEFWKAIQAGALTAARELGVEILWKGPLKEDDRNEQVQIVETLTNSGIDALILTPMDDRALVRPVEEAARLGIPTVIFNSALASEVPVAYLTTDNYRGGAMAAEHLGKLLKDGGRPSSSASWQASRERRNARMDSWRRCGRNFPKSGFFRIINTPA